MVWYEWVAVYFACNVVIALFRRLFLASQPWSPFGWGMVLVLGTLLEIAELVAWVVLRLRKIRGGR